MPLSKYSTPHSYKACGIDHLHMMQLLFLEILLEVREVFLLYFNASKSQPQCLLVILHCLQWKHKGDCKGILFVVKMGM